MLEPDSPFSGPRSAAALVALRTFETVSRLGGFRAAADALGLTPSAVSHQIKSLERTLGAPLFQRQGRVVVLSEAGARLAPFARQGFLAFARGTVAVRGGVRARQIRVSALGMFTQTVLIPNLGEFSRRWPDYDVRIEVKASYADFDRDDLDLAIRVGNGEWPGLKCTRLLQCAVAPTAAPRFIEEHGVEHPADLARMRLIHDAAQPNAWAQWLRAQGVTRANQTGDLWFDSSPATLHAAEQQLGLALAIDPLVRRWPGFGTRLVIAFPTLPGSRMRYWLARRADAENDPKVSAFSGWLRAACRALEKAP